MAASSERRLADGPASWHWLVPVLAGAGLLWFFPLFHVVPLAVRASGGATAGATFNAVSAAVRAWDQDIMPAAARAEDLLPLAAELRRDPAAAQRRAHQVGLGGSAYFFVRGRGRVIARSEDEVRLAVNGAEEVSVSLAMGPVFGNAVRDGAGVLNVNHYPGLEEFNALSAELNALVESRVVPVLRARAVVGATVTFAGCAPAPDGTSPDPLLAIVPVMVTVEK